MSKGTRNVELITACHARRMVNVSQVVLLSLLGPMESSKDSIMPNIGMCRNLVLENDKINWQDCHREEGNFHEKKFKYDGNKTKPISHEPPKVRNKIGDYVSQPELPTNMEIHSVVNVDKLKLFEPAVFDEESGESSSSAAELVNVQENIALKEKGNCLEKQKNDCQRKLVKLQFLISSSKTNKSWSFL
nr:hypothetical protein [Tanacetum cinerariifolium]